MDRWMGLSCRMTLQKMSMSWVAKRVAFWRRLATTKANACSKQSCAKILAYKKLLKIGSFSACTRLDNFTNTINAIKIKWKSELVSWIDLELGLVPDGVPNRVGSVQLGFGWGVGGAHGVDGEDTVGGGERGKGNGVCVGVVVETAVVGGERAALEHVLVSEPGAVVVAAETSHGRGWKPPWDWGGRFALDCGVCAAFAPSTRRNCSYIHKIFYYY